jgi:hypothetical protein
MYPESQETQLVKEPQIAQLGGQFSHAVPFQVKPFEQQVPAAHAVHTYKPVSPKGLIDGF